MILFSFPVAARRNWAHKAKEIKLQEARAQNES
jgi:hypothetical protein